MANIKARLEKLEAAAPLGAEDQVVIIERIIVGQFNPDGSPVTIIRRGQPYRVTANLQH